MEATRRIVKKTCKLARISPNGYLLFSNESKYYVQKQVTRPPVAGDACKIEWVTEHYSTGVDKESLAIFNTREEALAFVNGEFGKQTEEVIWTNNKYTEK